MRIGILVALAAIVAVYALFDPAETWWMPRCPVHALTGWDCPGCGSQRAIHSLLRGDVAAAFGFNAFLILISPYLVALAVAELNRHRWARAYRRLTSSPVIYTLLALIVLWSVARNLLPL